MCTHLLKIPKCFDDFRRTNNMATMLSPKEFPEQDFLPAILSLYHNKFLRGNFFDHVAKKYQSRILGFEKTNLYCENSLYPMEQYQPENHQDYAEHLLESEHQ